MRFNKKWKKVLQPDKGKYGIYKKAGIVLLLSIVMFSAVYVTDNYRQLAQDENGNRILERKGQGEGKKTEKIQMETGEWKEKMKVQISEKKYAYPYLIVQHNSYQHQAQHLNLLQLLRD